MGQTNNKQIRILPGSYTCRAENQKRMLWNRITEVIKEGLSEEETLKLIVKVRKEAAKQVGIKHS